MLFLSAVTGVTHVGNHEVASMDQIHAVVHRTLQRYDVNRLDVLPARRGSASHLVRCDLASATSACLAFVFVQHC